MLLFILGIILGFAINKKLNNISDFHKEFYILGFKLILENENDNKTELVSIDKVKKEKEYKKCGFCGGENIYIAGTKEVMPCPKCKKNKKKQAL